MKNKIGVFLFTHKYPIFLLLVSCFLTWTYFKHGHLIATAEEALTFYNPQRTLRLFSSLWVEISSGFPIAFLIPRIPVLFASAVLQQIVTPHLTQAFLFLFIFISGFIGSFYCFKSLTKIRSGEIALLVALFYGSNLFTLTQVWQRFLYPLFFLWAFLPVFLLLWNLLLETKQWKYMGWLVTASVVYSYTFTFPSSILLIGLAMLFISVLHIGLAKKKLRQAFFTLKAISIWSFCQLWWFTPLFFLRNSALSESVSTDQNISALREVSNFFSNSDVLLLKQQFFFNRAGYFSEYYQSGVLQSLSAVALCITLAGLILSLKLRIYRLLSLFFLLSWFLVKGSNAPFGDIFYTAMFEKIPFTQVLRNPYEKLGLLYTLLYSLFFGIGIYLATNKLPAYIRNVSHIVILGSLLVLAVPLWKGAIFPYYYYATVPQRYALVNEVVSGSQGRILQLPLSRGSTVEYSWFYRGEDPSEYLYDRPSISKFTTLSSLDRFYNGLIQNISHKNMPHLLAVANIGSAIVNYDLVKSPYFSETATDSSLMVQKWLNGAKPIKIETLEVYPQLQESAVGEVYLVDQVKNANDVDNAFQLMLEDTFNPKKTAVIETAQEIKIAQPRTLPSYSVQKIHPRHYQVKIKENAAPFLLVLTQSFNSNWKAIIDHKRVADHVLTNGYANGWIISHTGSYEIDIIFQVFPWE